MANFVLDSYAMLAYFRNENGAAKVAEYLHDAANGKCKLYMTCVNAGEVFYMSSPKNGTEKAELAWKALLQFPINFVDVDMEFTYAAANLKARFSFSYADAFAGALTIKNKATLVTGDKEFDALLKEPDFKVKYL